MSPSGRLRDRGGFQVPHEIGVIAENRRADQDHTATRGGTGSNVRHRESILVGLSSSAQCEVHRASTTAFRLRN